MVAKTHKIGTTEAVQNSNALLIFGQDLAVLDLLQDDRILMLNIVVGNSLVDLFPDLLGLFVITWLRMKAGTLGDEKKNNCS